MTLGDGDAAINVDVLESCSVAEMFSDCRSGAGEAVAVAASCGWGETEWGRRSGEFIVSVEVNVACSRHAQIVLYTKNLGILR